ncbi:hypothetical protein SSPO_040020 [Streptomyces antimycoticus]|uniref:YkuD domain-containing protein n=1 Tax=Streptomyces antimycoticus TaxID=68175 RepID=A0A499UI38_9ACTN|nr:hypothetical protein [Streptomyces antimycoticus]BBJ41284.1 hypothetical protein SSPO_040020 [Streptomyces antimycoticus]
MSPTDLPRRHALTAAAGVTVAAALASTGLLAAPALAAPQPLRNDELKEALRRVEARRRRLLTGRPSANRWEMEKGTDDGGDIATRPVPGTGLNVSVRTGDTATVLVHVIRRFHYEVATLGLHGEPNPIEGWVAPSAVRDSQLPEANRASGTAIVIRPDFYPPGVRGGFTSGQQLIIRDIIADTEGIVRWGGEDRRPYEGLFYLTVPPGDARLKRVAAKIRAWDETPGAGAGVVLDVTEPSRRRRAARYR